MKYHCKIIVNLAVKAVRADRSNKYRLLEDWEVGRFIHSLPDYDGPFIRLKNGVLICKASADPILDGATLAPDKIADVDLAVAWIPHDFLYTEMDAMAASDFYKTAGITASTLRKYADIVLYECIKALAMQSKGFKRFWLKGVARIYYSAARTFGGVAHTIGKILAIVLFCGFLSGCSGCAAPNGIFSPTFEDSPQYERVEAQNNPPM